MTRSHRSLLGIALALGVPCLPLARWENEFASVGHLVGYELIWWTLVAAVLVYVVRVEHRPLSSIGARSPGPRGVALGIAAGAVIVAAIAAVYYIVFPALGLNEDSQIAQLVTTPVWWRAISVVRAAVAEEILFRGYALERGDELSGSRIAAGAISCAVFTLAHVGPWSWVHVIPAATGGVLLTALYLWRRNVWVNIIAHLVVDGVAVLAR